MTAQPARLSADKVLAKAEGAERLPASLQMLPEVLAEPPVALATGEAFKAFAAHRRQVMENPPPAATPSEPAPDLKAAKPKPEDPKADLKGEKEPTTQKSGGSPFTYTPDALIRNSGAYHPEEMEHALETYLGKDWRAKTEATEREAEKATLKREQEQRKAAKLAKKKIKKRNKALQNEAALRKQNEPTPEHDENVEKTPPADQVTPRGVAHQLPSSVHFSGHRLHCWA